MRHLTGLSAIIPILTDVDTYYNNLTSSNTQAPQQLKVNLTSSLCTLLTSVVGCEAE